MLPLGFPNHGHALNVAEMLGMKFGVLPQHVRGPAVEIMHLDRDANLAVLFERQAPLR